MHGFLGSPSDWNFFQAGALHVDQIIGVDPSQSDFFSNLALKKKQNILIGYSLGGRRALHELIEKPSLWKAAIIISAHPGLTDEKQKEKRLEQDKVWAKRFLSEPWEPLLQAWNEQKTLATSHPLPRKEKDYDRGQLAFMLEKFSLGLQRDLRPDIALLPLPIFWLVGEKDETYISLARSLTFAHPLSCIHVLPQSGHRAPWDQPRLFEKAVGRWLSEIL